MTASLSRGARRLFARFFSDDRGVSAVVFAISMAAIGLAAGIAIDYGRIVTDRMRDQRALDAAVLAASDSLGETDAVTVGEARLKAFYLANRKQNVETDVDNIVIDPATGTVSAKTDTNWEATLLKGVESFFPGISKDRNISVSTKVQRGSGSVEIALVLDNSGSMSGEHIEALRSAASDLADTVFVGEDTSGKVAIGVVPFAASVNVGSINANSAWIDSAGVSSIHSENFAEPRSRLQLFGEIGQTWAGCVESRPNGLDVTDAAPVSDTPDSLFVPMFAPDEPGDAGQALSGYSNSYLDDDGGQCERYEEICVKYSRRGNCKKTETIRLPNTEAQARTCKYFDQFRSGGSGPNALCTTQPILPLNSTKSQVKSAIAGMLASGNTNIKEGVAWGWRVLSPGVPFTQGRAYGGADNRKIMILMTDGENYYAHRSNPNKSVYAAHGYASKGRLGTDLSRRQAYTTYLNARTKAVCDHAKAAGIEIYTVAFRLENDPTTKALLSYCASDSDKVFAASNGSLLVQSFRNIGRQITALRLSE